MIRMFLILLAITCSTPAFADGEKDDFTQYTNALEQCEMAQEKEMANENISTEEMKKSSYNLADCYKNVAFQVIDTFYSKNAQPMKEHFESFLSESYTVTNDIFYNHDKCPDNCGTAFQPMYTETAAQLLKQAVEDLIRYAQHIEEK